MTMPAATRDRVDHSSAKDGDVGGWRDRSARALFWTFAAVGLPVTFGGWMLLLLASYEEMSEQGKAVAAGTTMAGTTFAFGVIPLVLIHLIGLMIMCALGALGRINRGTGALFGFAAVVGASLLSLAVVLILNNGQLLASTEYIP